MEAIGELVKQDRYGIAFLDDLRAIESEFDSPEHDYPDFLLHHKQLIEMSLVRYASFRSIRTKFSWLRHYHNTTVCQRFDSRNARRFLIAPIRALE